MALRSVLPSAALKEMSSGSCSFRSASFCLLSVVLARLRMRFPWLSMRSVWGGLVIEE